MSTNTAAVVFVHGLFSSAQTWTHFDKLITDDPDLSGIDILHFEYSSPKFKINPLRRIPSFNVLADSFQTFLEIDAAQYSDLALVTHSQGGLIAQRYLSRMLNEGHGTELSRIRRIVMFACPNAGSEIAILFRRGMKMWRNPQEKQLRPINEEVIAAQKSVMNRVVHAQKIADNQCPILLYAYAGETDNIVSPASAKGVFPNTGVLPGDHSSIIQPDSHKHRSYTALRSHLVSSLFPLSNTDQTSTTESHAPPLTESSRVHARWNPATRRYDFDVSPDIALSWIRDLERRAYNADE